MRELGRFRVLQADEVIRFHFWGFHPFIVSGWLLLIQEFFYGWDWMRLYFFGVASLKIWSMYLIGGTWLQ